MRGGSLLVGFVILGLLAVPVGALEDPRFETTVSEPELQPGAQQTLTVTITNDDAEVDDRVTTASNVVATATSGSTPVEVLSGPQRLGRLADGVDVPAQFRIEVPADAPGGTYQLPIELTYEYDGDERETDVVGATVEIPRRPIFAIEAVETDLFRSETGVVSLAVRNTGSRPANDTSLALSSANQALSIGGAPTGSAHLGDLAPNGTTEVALPVTAAPSALARAYPLTVAPRYENANGIPTTAPTRQIGVAPAAGTRIEVTEVLGAVRRGETGRLTLTMENAGSSTLTEAVLHLESAAPGLSFEGAGTNTQFLGTWAPGEVRTVAADLRLAETAEPGTGPIQATVRFVHETGVQSRAGPYAIGVGPPPGQEFAFEAVSMSHQGPGAVLSARVRNEGDRIVEDAVVTLESTGHVAVVTEDTDAVGSLSPGEAATIEFALRGPPDANLADEHLRATVEYDLGGAQIYRSDAVELVPSDPVPETLFEVEPRNGTLDVDATNELRVEITNEGDRALRNLQAHLDPRPTYTSQSPTGYVARLEPGAATILTFEVTTPDDGVPTTDALALNVTAETEAGRPVLDGPHLVPVTVDSGGGGPSGSTAVAIGAIVVILLFGGGWWWLNR
jgi:hypothetical protein